jgi:hypothetical protein
MQCPRVLRDSLDSPLFPLPIADGLSAFYQVTLVTTLIFVIQSLVHGGASLKKYASRLVDNMKSIP